MRANPGFWTALLYFFSTLPGTAAVTPRVPEIPLGFEQSGDRFLVQTLNTAYSVESNGLKIRSRGSLLRIRFHRARSRAKLSGQGDAGTLNRFIGNRPELWQSRIPLARSVEAHDIYRGIDIAYHGSNRSLEYDFIVRPGADPRRIALELAAADKGFIDPSGNLRVATPRGAFVQHKPSAFQTIDGVLHSVTSNYRIDARNLVHIDVGPYDRSAPLTIDPLVSYVSYLGGAAADTATSIAVDGSGDIFIAGNTSSTTNGNQNVFLFKLPPTGTPTQSVFGGTTGSDSANALVLDSSGNVYLAGSTSSSNFPVTGTQFAGVTSGLIGVLNAFVIAFPSTILTPTFSTYIGGNNSDQALAMALGPDNILYVAGDTNSTSFPEFALTSTGGVAFQETNHGGYDAFVLALSTSGVGQFSTYIGGSGDDHAHGVAVTSSGYVDVVGSTASTDFPPAGSSTTANQGGTDAFVIQLLPSESSGGWGVWSTLVGGSGADSASGVALDSNDNVYVSGTTGSTNFPNTTGVYQTTFQGGTSDGFVFALQGTNGAGAWSTYLGSANDDALNAIAMDSSGNIYVAGTTDSTTWPVTSDAAQATNAGSQDAVIAKLNSKGTSLLYSTYLGGSGNDIGNAIAINSIGNIFVAGLTQSSSNDLPVTANAYQATYGGGTSDAFVAVLGCSTDKPVIATGGIGNAASFQTNAISPGAAMAIFGTGLGCTAGSAESVPLPLSLGGVSVQVNGAAVPLYYASSGQINAQLPFDVPIGTATVTVTAAGGTSAASTINVIAAGPGIFTASGQAAALNQDGTLNTTTNGAKPGTIISVYFTGQGPVNPAVLTGVAAPDTPLSNVTLPHSATIGGQTAAISFMGLAPGFVGLAQANLTVPAGLTAGDYPLILTIQGAASASTTVTISQ